MVVAIIRGSGAGVAEAEALEFLSVQGQEPYGAQEFTMSIPSLYPRIVQKWFK